MTLVLVIMELRSSAVFKVFVTVIVCVCYRSSEQWYRCVYSSTALVWHDAYMQTQLMLHSQVQAHGTVDATLLCTCKLAEAQTKRTSRVIATLAQCSM
jgi:hypothetical protein